MGFVDSLNLNGVSYGLDNFRWQFLQGTVYPAKRFSNATKGITDSSDSTEAASYTIPSGTQKVRVSCASLGSSANVAYCFLDENDNILLEPTFSSGEMFKDVEITVPTGATKLFLNGNNYLSPHCEIAVIDLMSNRHTLPYLLDDLARKISYHDTFAWKPMDKGYIALTFDDSINDIDEVYAIAHAKGVPVCFGAIPEKLNYTVNSNQTVLDIMKLAIADGGEVLAHGNNAEMVTSENIDDLNFLYNKFVVNKHKFKDVGITIRGDVRVGGSGNITHDARTDVWQKLIFDYGDDYGIAEPYFHTRGTYANEVQMYAAIDNALANHTFLPLLFHDMPEDLGDIIDYIINNGGDIKSYAYVYDTFGSTTETVSILNRLSALENSDANNIQY